MAKTFKNLIRLREWQLDEKRRALGELMNRLDVLEGEAVGHEKRIREEQRIARDDPEQAGRNYGAFARWAIQRRQELAAAIAHQEQLIAAARDDLGLAFRDLKSIVLAQDARDRRAAEELEHRTQAFLDELGLQQHRRREALNSNG